MYIPNRAMPEPESLTFRGWLMDELTRISSAQKVITIDSITLNVLNVQPTKLFDGLTVLADGTDWNPGSGEGVYTYYNSTWNKLG